VFAAALILLAIFLGGNELFKATLSSSNMRFLAKASAISCTLVILVIQLLFNATADGIYLTYPICLIFGVGFIAMTLIASSLIMVVYEFPVMRVYQLTLLPYLSHDEFLLE
jgi:hypothetical protein